MFLLGLTGVGKSTAVNALQTSGVPLTLLPNRRTLTDELIIPEMQRAAGSAVKPVKDRLERFELTRHYRKTHPGGVVHALLKHLERHPYGDEETLLFDNLRAPDEARAAAETFTGARFIALDAPPLVRLLRLVGRHDDFDQVAAQIKSTSFTEQLLAVENLNALFDANKLALLAAQGVPRRDILKAVHIIVGEAQNYDMNAAAAYLHETQTAATFLHLDTADLSPDTVRARIRAWL